MDFEPCEENGECYCHVPNNVTLQYGQFMELTVDVTNSSPALSCTWYTVSNEQPQVKNTSINQTVESILSPSFFKVRGDKNQVIIIITMQSEQIV